MKKDIKHPNSTAQEKEQTKVKISKRMEIIKIRAEIREGNGTPLQYSCLENPMDGGA